MLVTKEEGRYIIKALLKILLAAALFSYIVVNEYRHREIIRVNRVGDQLFEQLTKTDETLMRDLKVLRGIHFYVFKELNDEARSTLP